MTISEYASRHGVSASTVRRRIKSGALSARLVGGRYFINDEQLDSRAGSQDEHVDNQNDQGADRPELVAQLQSEVDYLRSQLDKQTSLLAVAAQQNTSLTKQLERPKSAAWAWVRLKLQGFSAPGSSGQ